MQKSDHGCPLGIQKQAVEGSKCPFGYKKENVGDGKCPAGFSGVSTGKGCPMGFIRHTVAGSKCPFGYSVSIYYLTILVIELSLSVIFLLYYQAADASASGCPKGYKVRLFLY